MRDASEQGEPGGTERVSREPLKIRSRKFDGRCGRHKRYNPPTDGTPAAQAGCPRCQLLFEIWQSSLKLNQLIRKFNPRHDDLQKPPSETPEHDPRQLSLLVDGPLSEFR